MKVIIFKSKPDNLFSFIIIATCFLLCCMPVFYLLNAENYDLEGYAMIIFLLSIAVYLLWSFFSVKYTLSSKKLKYYSGFIKGEIEIESISQIVQGKTMWSGNRIASSRNGLILKYNKFDDIYISPESNEEFIKEILKINPRILVRDTKQRS